MQAIAAAALVGPAQVAPRLLEFFVLRRAHPVVSARIACALHPIGAALLIVAGVPGAPLFAVFYGAGMFSASVAARPCEKVSTASTRAKPPGQMRPTSKGEITARPKTTAC